MTDQELSCCITTSLTFYGSRGVYTAATVLPDGSSYTVLINKLPGTYRVRCWRGDTYEDYDRATLLAVKAAANADYRRTATAQLFTLVRFPSLPALPAVRGEVGEGRGAASEDGSSCNTPIKPWNPTVNGLGD